MDPPERLVPYMDTPGGAFNLRRLFSPGLTAALRQRQDLRDSSALRLCLPDAL